MSEIQSRYFAPLLWILIRIWCKVIYSYQNKYLIPLEQLYRLIVPLDNKIFYICLNDSIE